MRMQIAYVYTGLCAVHAHQQIKSSKRSNNRLLKANRVHASQPFKACRTCSRLVPFLYVLGCLVMRP